MRDLEVGYEIPPFVRQPGLHHWNRFAAVNDEFVPIHMDDDAGRAAGYPSAFGQGNLQWSFLHNVLRQWMGDDGNLERLTCTFRGANVKGQTVTARGRITAVTEDGVRRIVELDVWTENEVGEPLAPGSARISLPAGNDRGT
jgi:acyl dehydratase